MASSVAYTASDLYDIAKNQRRLLLIILCSLLLYVALIVIGAAMPSGDTEAMPDGQAAVLGLVLLGIVITFLALGIAWVIVLVFLLIALRTPIVWRIIAIFAAFVPVVSLAVLVIVSSRATVALQRANCKVGLLGVSGKTLRELQQASTGTAQ